MNEKVLTIMCRSTFIFIYISFIFYLIGVSDGEYEIMATYIKHRFTKSKDSHQYMHIESKLNVF